MNVSSESISIFVVLPSRKLKIRGNFFQQQYLLIKMFYSDYALHSNTVKMFSTHESHKAKLHNELMESFGTQPRLGLGDYVVSVPGIAMCHQQNTS